MRSDFAVIKLLDDVDSWLDLCSIAIQGYKVLKERHSNGRSELIRFLKLVEEGNCIRKLFGPTIGMNEAEERTCGELIESGDYCMPCSNCRNNHLSSSDKFIWSTNNILAQIGALEVQVNPLPDFDSIRLNENISRKKKGLDYFPFFRNENGISLLDMRVSFSQWFCNSLTWNRFV